MKPDRNLTRPAQPIVPRGSITALSRLERGFESRWERHEIKTLPILVKAILSARVPLRAKACDKNLTRLPQVIGRHGLRHEVIVRDQRGRSELRYLTDEQLTALRQSAPGASPVPHHPPRRARRALRR